MIEIYLIDDSDLAEFEAISKGYRNDVYVRINNDVFSIKVYDNVRLKQDFDEELSYKAYYSIEVNLILVKEVNKENILFTINNLYEEEFFSELKPSDNIKVEQLKKIQ